jgi:hypothetical protein
MDVRSILRFAVIGLVLAIRPLSAQVPTMASLKTGTATISGRVVDARSGEPLADVAIALTAPRIAGVLATKSAADGTYQFVNLAEHEYNVRVMDPLYASTCYGATDAIPSACDPVTLVRDQRRTGIDLRLTPMALLRGRVLDEAGRPVARANLAAQPAPTAAPAGLPSGAQTKTDGSFEMSLPGGDWLLSVDMPVTADKPRPPAVFYPGVIGIQEAEAIRVTAGLVTSDLTFRYPRITDRSLTARISLPAPGATAVKAYVYRVEPRMGRAIALDADGAGTVKGLLEGRYHVTAQAVHDGQTLVASDVAHVMHDETEIALLLAEPGRITGKVVAERGTLPPLADALVAAGWIDDDGEEINPVSITETALAPDASFRFDGLFGLRRLQLVGLPPDWRVQSIRHGRSDVASTGVTVAPGATIDIVITIAQR